MSKPRHTRGTYGSAEFKSRCLQLVDRVKQSRTEVIITRHGRPVARLVPYGATEPQSFVGSMANTVLALDQPFEPVPAVWSLRARDDES